MANNKGKVTIDVVIRDLGTRAIAGIRGALGSLSNFARTAALRIGGLVTALTGLSGVGVVAFLVQTNRQFEKFLAQLRTFEGSDAAARSAFTVLERFAAKTPFQIEESVQAFIHLRSMGIQPTIQMLEDFGNFASAMGGRIDDFARATRSLATGEIEAMKAFGVTASVMGDNITIRFQDQSIKVKRNAQEVADALQQIGAMKFSGAMEREMKTLNGAISNLQDNLGRIARAIGEAGFIGGSKGIVAGLVAWTGAIADNKVAIQQWVTVVVDTLAVIQKSFSVFLAFLGTVEARWNKFNAFMSTTLNETPNMLAERMRMHTRLVDEADEAFKRAIAERERIIADRAMRFRQSAALLADQALRSAMDVNSPGAFPKVSNDQLAGDRGVKGLTAPGDASKAAETLKERIALLATLGETGNMSLAGIAAHEARLRGELARTQTTLQERVELEQALLAIRQQLAEQSGAIADVPAIDRIIRQQQERGMTPGTPTVPIDPFELPSGDPAELDTRSVWERLDDGVNQGKTALESLRETIDDIATGSLVAFGDAIMNAFAGLVSGSESVGAALAKAITGFLASAAKGFGDFFISQAIASFASVTAPPPMGPTGPAGIAAGKKYLLAAAGMYAIAGAAGGAASGIGGGAGSGSRAGGFNATNSFAGAAKGDGYLIVEGDFLDLNNPITKQRFRRALEEFSGRRVHIKNSRFGTVTP